MKPTLTLADVDDLKAVVGPTVRAELREHLGALDRAIEALARAHLGPRDRLPLRDAAVYLGVSPEKVRALIRERRLPGVTRQGRVPYIPTASLDAYMAEGTAVGDDD